MPAGVEGGDRPHLRGVSRAGAWRGARAARASGPVDPASPLISAGMAERSFAEEVNKLRLGEGETFAARASSP